MFRKMLFAGVASLGVLSPLAVAAPASAHEWEHRGHEWEHRHHREFHVYFRGCNREPWRFAGEFGRFDRARCRADELRARGFEVIIR
jgi:hypothetical protein